MGVKLFKKIYGLLDIPWVYRLSQVLLAPGKSLLFNRICNRIFHQSTGLVLDVGCGPKLVTPRPPGRWVGVDINESYIRKYTGGFLDKNPEWVSHPPDSRKCLGFLAPADHLPFADASFDEVRAVGFLHHLSHETGLGAIREMYRCLRPGGTLIVLEDIWPLKAWTRPIAWLTRKLDRGKFMRTQAELLELFQEACPGPWEWKRYTYTFTGSELLHLNRTKK